MKITFSRWFPALFLTVALAPSVASAETCDQRLCAKTMELNQVSSKKKLTPAEIKDTCSDPTVLEALVGPSDPDPGKLSCIPSANQEYLTCGSIVYKRDTSGSATEKLSKELKEKLPGGADKPAASGEGSSGAAR
ncbi:MAG: hypothetical protein NDJ89_13470 [Oligoflexia bacterium]|nr:hypothetical protein [Oligoflexia bacterium]